MTSKNNPSDPRLQDLTNFFQKSLDQDLSEISKLEEKFVLLGYPDDEGIRINQGRPGAAEAPQGIRQILYKMTPHLMANFSPEKKIICDLGNIETSVDLARRHQNAKKILSQIYQAKKIPITLGGGHDYGYSDTSAFVQQFKNSQAKPLVINFDAHLDVRPLDQGLSSGTPFFRLLEENSTSEFDFLEVGLQPQCNSQAHLQYLKNKKADYLLWNECTVEQLKKKTQGPLMRPCFISLDIDVFHSAEAPGCSQSWPLGLQLQQFLPLFNYLMENFDVKGLGIYEVSPPLDTNLNTQRLAAVILHQFLFHSRIGVA